MEKTNYDKIIVESAGLKNGVFAKSKLLDTKIINCDKNFLLCDGSFLYPIHTANIAMIKKQLKNISFTGILGVKEKVLDLIDLYGKENFIIIEKDFHFLANRLEEQSPAPAGVSLETVKTPEDLKEFSRLKSQFMYEESGIKISTEIIYNDLKEYYPSLKPVLLKYKNKAAGMASSNFHSPESAMLNMLYVAKKYRGNGYGEILARWYVRYLKKDSKNICLFVSPDNIRAEKIYLKIGFKKTDDWLMALWKSRMIS